METVTIKLGGREVFRVNDYRIKVGIFEQPGAFECALGRPYPFRTLAEAFPPRTPYQIFMGSTLIQTGLTDAFSASNTDATEIRLSGRGLLGWLTTQYIDKELSFASPTYFKLVDEALKRSGLSTLMDRFGLDGERIVASNEANRKVFTGSARAKSLTKKTVEVIETEAGGTEGEGTKRVYEHIRAEVGTSWWQFLVEQLRRAGLFLWEGVDGRLILATPNVEQLPVFRLVRTAQENNILAHTFSHNTAQRHSECVVFGRGKKGKSGTDKFDGRYVDEEMVAFLNPRPEDRANGGVLKIVKTIRDSEVRSKAQSEALARREMAEERRASWQLSYTIQDHYIREIAAAVSARPAPETLCEVHDDYLGLYGHLFVEGVEFIGTEGATMTSMSMLRPEDVFFRVPENPPPALKKSGANTGPVDTRVILGAIGTVESRLVNAPGLGEFEYPASDFDRLDELPTTKREPRPTSTTFWEGGGGGTKPSGES